MVHLRKNNMLKKPVKKEVKEVAKPVVKIETKSEYDPNLPMNKQRHLR